MVGAIVSNCCTVGIGGTNHATAGYLTGHNDKQFMKSINVGSPAHKEGHMEMAL